MRAAVARLARLLAGERPGALLVLLVPTLLAIAVDAILRARSMAGWALQGKLIYLSSVLVSVGFWAWPLWVAGRLLSVSRAGSRAAATLGLGLLALLWIFPFATFCYAGQALYYRVFFSYMGRDTLRLGILLRGTVRDWFAAWGGAWLAVGMMAVGAVVTIGVGQAVRRSAPRFGRRVPLILPIAFLTAGVLFWTDNVDSRFLQAATPDTCFVHGVVHAARMALTGRWRKQQGVSLRTPAALPPLTSARERPPNIVLILTESVRADAICSDPPPTCRAPFLDETIPDRLSLGKLSAETPNTFSACMVLWTGLSPDVDFTAAHTAPVLWEIARAVGYKTAYITSQNPKYEDFGAYVRRAGIDVLVMGTELGGMGQEQLGAPDERAGEQMLRFVRSVPEPDPYFVVLHLSNTHAPYRVDPALQPFAPHATDPLGDATSFHNHYKNSVRMQERLIAGLIRELRALPRWDETVVVFLSDHGEQFREHGGLYHNHSLYEEELRVPGWIAGGRKGLDDAARAALGSYAGRRTYAEDVHETVVDLLGVEASRAMLPLASRVTGRSLLRTSAPSEPTVLLATSTAVWEPDDARFGVRRGERVLMGAPQSSWACFDTARDPSERAVLPAAACRDLREVATRAFGSIGVLP
jgi:hypothetical protein